MDKVCQQFHLRDPDPFKQSLEDEKNPTILDLKEIFSVRNWIRIPMDPDAQPFHCKSALK